MAKKTTTSKNLNKSECTENFRKNISNQTLTHSQTESNLKTDGTTKKEIIKTKSKSQKTILKHIYMIILSITLLATTIIEITNSILLVENALPKEKNDLTSQKELQTEEPPKPTKEELERAKINNLFSVDVDLNIAREENKNNDIIARMEIPNVFNLLVTQTKDNDYYLDYNIKKQRSDKGNEFIDYRNTILDKQINVYGHNSRLYDLPFKQIELFLDKEFFDNNKYLLLQHDGGRRIYQIAAIKKVRTDNEHMLVKAKYQKEHISKLMNNTIYNRDLEYDDNTNIIVLQTCVRQEDRSYYILIGFEITI